MQAPADGDNGDREEELETLTAIFPEIQVGPQDRYAFSLELPVDFEDPLYLERQSSHPTAAPAGAEQHGSDTRVDKVAREAQGSATAFSVDLQVAHHVSHLPPLQLMVSLPVGYPSQSGPVVKVETAIPWLPSRTKHLFEAEAHSLWLDGGKEAMIFNWISYVQEEISMRCRLPSSLIVDDRTEVMLLDHHASREQQIFADATFTCPVCLEHKRGRYCHQMFTCGHVTCLDCLQDGYGAMISSGNIADVKCMHFGCAKRQTDDDGRPVGDVSVSAEELAAIPLPDEQVVRYRRLKRKAAETKATIYCPRPWCQEAATVSSAGLEPQISAPRRTAAELAQCTGCGLAFCSLCYRSWHGAFVTCRPRDGGKLSAEERATLEYIAAYSSPCPQCMTQVQKTNGCNHMQCSMCQSHFCYLCSERLLPKNPYAHFNNRKSGCNNRLWDKEEGDGTDVRRRGSGDGYAVAQIEDDEDEDQIADDPRMLLRLAFGRDARAVGGAGEEDEDEEMMRIFANLR